MLPYPSEEIDRIIHEGVSQDKGAVEWRGSVMYLSIRRLLLERLCAAWQRPGARASLEALLHAEFEVLRMCTDDDKLIYGFKDDTKKVPIEIFTVCQEALALVALSSGDWAVPCAMPETLLAEQIEEWASRLEQRIGELKRGLGGSGCIAVAARVFAQIHDALRVAYTAFMDPAEDLEFDQQLMQALTRMSEFAAELGG